MKSEPPFWRTPHRKSKRFRTEFILSVDRSGLIGVKQHEGFIEVESSRDRGSTFHVLLPVCDNSGQEVASEGKMRDIVSASGEDETVLVVEDEPAVREYVSAVLTTNG